MSKQGFKKCACCGKEKPIFHFHKSKPRKDNLHPYCKACRRLKSNKRYSENKERILKKNKEYLDSIYGTDKFRDSWLKKRYGLTLKDWNKMFEEQNGCCAICGRHQSYFTQSLGVDHNHETGMIRGLLCTSCNRGVGYLQEDIKVLQQAINYLNLCGERSHV